jgi:signal transduction histidine kinase
MRTRRWLTWVVFAVCVLAVLEGLGWVTYRALRAERREAQARAESEFQETVRLAMWRMEAEVTPIIGQEASRPYFHYLSFYPADRAYTRMLREVEKGEVLVPSPLLEQSGQCIRLHFQVEPDGRITSPQAPTGNLLDLAESQYVDPEFIILAEQRLTDLRAMLAAPAERAEAGRSLGAASRAQIASPPQVSSAPQQLESPAPQQGQTLSKSAEASQKESEARQRAYQQAANVANEVRRNRDKAPETPPAATAAREPALDSIELKKLEAMRDDAGPQVKQFQSGDYTAAEVQLGTLTPRWLPRTDSAAQELIFQRTVRVEGRTITQGFWMDWPALRTRILGAAGDLLPRAELRPVNGEPSLLSAMQLASVPVRLIPGDSPAPLAIALTATHATLVVTWLAVLGAIVAIAIVLRTAMELGDRRGRFVSAVTHELRTPLTTFCLYTEMLADDMVKEETTRRDYLGTLKAESRRLAGIVENVLDFARLGGQRRAIGQPAQPAAVVFDSVVPALSRAAAQSGMTLEVASTLSGAEQIAVEPRTVERILLNLIENSCKYASDAADPRIHLSLAPTRHRGSPFVQATVSDHGPGIPWTERRRIFQPFHRARRDAEGPKSGLGLGLALARGLARGMGGELECAKSELGGATIRLLLPAS